jgi:hypothetical protein
MGVPSGRNPDASFDGVGASATVDISSDKARPDGLDPDTGERLGVLNGDHVERSLRGGIGAWVTQVASRNGSRVELDRSIMMFLVLVYSKSASVPRSRP